MSRKRWAFSSALIVVATGSLLFAPRLGAANPNSSTLGPASAPLRGNESAVQGMPPLTAAVDNWRLISALPRTVRTPLGREGAGTASDAARGVIVIFGGNHSENDGVSRQLDDTWTWDGTKWVEAHPLTRPPSRSRSVMAYHAGLGKAFLFGGLSFNAGASTYLNDTWAWDGANWAQVSTANSPPGREGASLAYDPVRENIVLFGGINRDLPNQPMGNTWIFDGNDWSQANTPVSPGPRYAFNSVMTYMPANGGLLLFGGSGSAIDDGKTWIWNGSKWSFLTPLASPPSNLSSAMAYHTASSRAVFYVFGSDVSGPGETWTWDGTNWQRSGSVSPRSRFGSIFVEHAPTARLLMYGGGSCGQYNDQWLWDGASWTEMDLGDRTPPARTLVSAQVSFDRTRDLAVLFGGFSDCIFPSDTWTWNGSSWRRVQTSTSPAGRIDGSMAYDATRGVTFLFGGRETGGFNNFLDDSWTFDGSNWTQQSPLLSPSRRIAAGIAYDDASAEVVLFGGSVEDALGELASSDETWTWNGSEWRLEAAVIRPAARAGPSMSRDAQGRPVLFGGADATGNVFSDTWRWNGQLRIWEQIAMAGAGPSPRLSASMGYDAASQRTILFGGGRGGEALGETWALDADGWRVLSPALSPSPRSSAGFADGSSTNPPVLFGGAFPGKSSDTWVWGPPVTPVQALGAVSRKIHGEAGAFEIDLPLTGDPGIECRSGGPSGAHQLVFKFLAPVTVSGASVTPEPGNTAEIDGTLVRSSDGKEVTVNLQNVSNEQTIAITLFDVSDGTTANDVSLSMGVLLGDTTADGEVNSADITQARRQSGQVTIESNKRIDLTPDGVVNSADITLVRRASGTALPLYSSSEAERSTAQREVASCFQRGWQGSDCKVKNVSNAETSPSPCSM